MESKYSSVLKSYERECKNNLMKKQSLANRVSAIKKFLQYLESINVEIQNVKFYNVEDFFDVEKNNDTSLNTIHNYYSFLKGFFKFCNLYKYNETLDYSKVNFDRVAKRKIEIFETKELEELISLIPKLKSNEIRRVRDTLVFKMLIFSGCTLSELHSLKVYNSEQDIVLDEDSYIAIKEKVIFFLDPIQRRLPLPDPIINFILMYRRLIEAEINGELPTGSYLLISLYNNRDGKKRLSPGALQDRMSKIKRISSFKDKKLSIKNIRHTFIYQMVNQGVRLDIVSQIVGLDVASLKYYLISEDIYNNEIKNVMSNEHPFKEMM